MTTSLLTQRLVLLPWSLLPGSSSAALDNRWQANNEAHFGIIDLLSRMVFYKLGLWSELPQRDLRSQRKPLGLADALTHEAKPTIKTRIPSFSPAEYLPHLEQAAQGQRSRYVLWGVLQPARQLSDEETYQAFYLNVVLYDATHQNLAVHTTHFIELPGLLSNQAPGAEVLLEALDKTLNQALLLCLLYIQSPDTLESLWGLPEHRLVYSFEALLQLADAETQAEPAQKVDSYLQLLSYDPRMEVAYAQLGKLAKQQRQYEVAASYYQNAVTVSQAPVWVQAQYATEQGVCLALQGQTAAAIEAWEHALALNPNFLSPYLNMAHTYESQGDLELAERLFLQAQAINPADSRLYYNLARIYSRTNQWAKALAQYQGQLMLDADDPWCHSNIATCFLQLDNEIEASYHLNKAVELDANGEAGQYAQLILTGLMAADFGL